MDNFVYLQPTKYIFGKRAQREVGHLIANLSTAKKVLIVYDTDRIEKNGLLSEITGYLTEQGISFWMISGVVPNPRLDIVYKGVELVRREGIDAILAIGGGSVMDTGKAIGAAAVYPGDPKDLCNGVMAEEALPIGVILTLAATGSEGAMFAIISEVEDGKLVKKPIMGEAIRPKFAIMNPELTYSVPKWQTACGSFDMMSHIMENYFSTSPNPELIDGMIEGMLRAIISAAPIALQQPNNYEARATLMWASTLCNNGMMGLGRISDTTPHCIGETFGACFDLTHGASIAVAFIEFMKMSYKKNVSKFAKFAYRVWDVPVSNDPEKDALKGIGKMEDFIANVLGIPLKLSDLGVKNASIYANGFADSINIDEWNETPGYCLSFDKNEIYEILERITHEE